MNAPIIRIGLLTFAACAVLAAPAEISAQQRMQAAVLHTGAAEAAAVAPAPAKRKRDTKLITAEEIRENHVSTAHDAVSRLRPNWLRQRGVSSVYGAGTIPVYQDEVRFGGPGSLQQINAGAIESIRYLDGLSATQRFGTGHGNGAIMVTSRH